MLHVARFVFRVQCRVLSVMYVCCVCCVYVVGVVVSQAVFRFVVAICCVMCVVCCALSFVLCRVNPPDSLSLYTTVMFIMCSP